MNLRDYENGMGSMTGGIEHSEPESLGPLHGLRVLEIASEAAAFCGKLLGDYGADVLLVEPPGGHYTRNFEPFVNDVPDVNRSLWFWHYNTSKSNICLDLTDVKERDAFL